MSYFSRLTDIVTCNLTELISQEADPRAAIEKIIAEMQEGLAGAKRSVDTAAASRQRLEKELAEHREQIAYWMAQAKETLAAGDEDQARLALVRKQEVVDLVGGLDQQYNAASATCEHLTTMLRALEARLADARRKQQQLESGTTAEAPATPAGGSDRIASLDESRTARIDAELDALKRELGQ